MSSIRFGAVGQRASEDNMAHESERSGSGRAIGIGGGALIIVLVAVVAVLLLNRPADQAVNGSAEPIVGSSPAGSASASASPIATGASASVGPTSSAAIQPASDWQEAAAFGADGTLERAESITRTSDGFIAVGTWYGVADMPHSGPV